MLFGVKSDNYFDVCVFFPRQNLETIISKLSKEQPNGRRNSFMLVSAFSYKLRRLRFDSHHTAWSILRVSSDTLVWYA